MCPVSHVRCYMSLVICHLSYVTCQMLHVNFFLQSDEVGLLRVFRRIDTQHLPISACSGPFLVIKKANWLEFNFREVRKGQKCHKWEIAALAAPAPCSYFQKLDGGRDYFIFYSLDLFVFSSFCSALFHGWI